MLTFISGLITKRYTETGSREAQGCRTTEIAGAPSCGHHFIITNLPQLNSRM